jgi:hypothetical protein
LHLLPNIVLWEIKPMWTEMLKPKCISTDIVPSLPRVLARVLAILTAEGR